MEMYNLKFDNTKEGYNNLALNINNKLLRDEEGHLLKNKMFLCFLNNNPCSVYINTRNIIHIIMIEKSRTQTEFILKSSRKGIVDYILKPYNTIEATPKNIMDECYNLNLLGHKPVEIIL